MKRTIGKQMLIVSSLVLAVGFGYQVFGQQTAENLERDEANSSEAQRKEGMQCPMMAAMKKVKLFADSPPVLLGQVEKLDLTQQQQRQLQEIGDSARKQALTVLTAEQREQVEKAPSGPLSMMQLAKLQKKEGASGKDEGMCPMCMKMMREKMKDKTASETDAKAQP